MKPDPRQLDALNEDHDKKPRTAGKDDRQQVDFRIMPRLIFGFSLICLLVLGGGVWAGTAKLSGAIIASGTVVVKQHKKKVQHNEGGIIASINVRNGQLVRAGDVLLTLDDTRLKARIGVMQAQETELLVRSERLRAERDGESRLVYSEALRARGAGARQVMTGESRLFAGNIKYIKGKIDQHNARVAQLRSEIRGLELQLRSKQRERKLVLKELTAIKRLKRKGLTRATRVYAKEREAIRNEGEIGDLTARIARAKGQINEIRVQILSVRQEARSKAQRELRDLEAKLTELRERQIAARDQLRRVDIRAPISGIVHELAVHTVGGIVTPAEQIMLIVPKKDKLVVKARIAPTDIDQIYPGQQVRLRFSAFSQNTTPEIPGQLYGISADVSKDRATGQNFYTGLILLDKPMLDRLGQKKLIPGMPVDVFISTGSRTALSYFTKPFMDHLNRTFREQ